MRKSLVLAGSALATVMSQSALAGDDMDHTWYLSAAVGANWADGFFDIPATGSVTTAEGIDADMGWSVAASVGHRMGGNWRLEAELTGRWNDFDGSAAGPGGSAVITGDIQVLAAMANVVFDIGMGEDMGLMLGAGIGYAWADVGLTVDATTTGGFSTHITGDDDESGFAYQGIAGISMNTGERSQVFLEYRYFAVNGLDAFAPFVDDYDAHTVRVGLRFDMNGGH